MKETRNSKFIIHNSKKGFTLIELLVVISIIGILASLALTSYSGAQKQARDTQRKSDLGQYRNALEAYASNTNGIYPIHATTGTNRYNVSDFCTAVTGELINYISACPADPTSTNYYSYISNASGTAYILYMKMETGNYWYICSSGVTGQTTNTTRPTTATCP